TLEPTPLSRAVLTETVRLNGYEGIVNVRGEAAALRSGETVFFDTGDEGSNANSLVGGERMTNSFPVKMISVDELVAAEGIEPSCLKVDVEGSELDVLLGARRTVERFRPAISLGLHPASIER